MGRQLKFFGRTIVMLTSILLFLAGAFILVNGSLEMYPTSEQQGKNVIVGVVLVVSGGVAGIIALCKWGRS